MIPHYLRVVAVDAAMLFDPIRYVILWYTYVHRLPFRTARTSTNCPVEFDICSLRNVLAILLGLCVELLSRHLLVMLVPVRHGRKIREETTWTDVEAIAFHQRQNCVLRHSSVGDRY